jgi:hypothetical protein
MTYVIREARDGWAVDTDWPISPSLAQRIASTPLTVTVDGKPVTKPVTAVGQYVGLEDNGAGDITADRLTGILDAGLDCWLIQHALNPGWHADAALGKRLGANARRNAQLVGYLEGCHLEWDQEGCASVGQPVSDCINAWVDQVVDVYPALTYVGYQSGLTSSQWYTSLPKVHAYHSDYGPRSVDTRAFVLKQHAQQTWLGIPIDADEILTDNLGGRLRCMASVSLPAVA